MSGVCANPDLTVDLVRSKIAEYLCWVIDWDDLDDWVSDHDRDYESPQTEARSMLSTLSLMQCECVCSGSFRSESAFRSDLKSMLAGEEMTAFWGTHPIFLEGGAEILNRMYADREEKMKAWDNDESRAKLRGAMAAVTGRTKVAGGTVSGVSPSSRAPESGQ